MLLFCYMVGLFSVGWFVFWLFFFFLPAVAGIIKHIKYRAGKAQIILMAEGEKKILSRFCASFSPRNLRAALSFSNPENVNLRGWGNFSCPPTSRAAENKTRRFFFSYSLLNEHLEEMRAPPLTASLPPRCCLYFFFFPSPSLA